MYRWSIELEGIFVLPLAPRWVRHSYLSKEATIDPLYLWVITLDHAGKLKEAVDSDEAVEAAKVELAGKVEKLELEG